MPGWYFVLERPSYPKNWLLPSRLVTANFITVQNKDLENVIGDCCFVSVTFRLFKFPKTGPTKRYQVIYNGGIIRHEKDSIFDANLTFKKDETVKVDEETAAILKNSQFAQDFLIRPIGEKLPTCGGYTALAAKDTITDPSKAAQGSDNTKSRSLPTVAGCCHKEMLLKQQLSRRQWAGGDRMSYTCLNLLFFIAPMTRKNKLFVVLKNTDLCFPQWLSSKESACNAGATGNAGLISGLRKSPGRGHSNPLQYSCLENPMDRGAWQATVHGAAKSRSQMKQRSSNSSSSIEFGL